MTAIDQVKDQPPALGQSPGGNGMGPGGPRRRYGRWPLYVALVVIVVGAVTTIALVATEEEAGEPGGATTPRTVSPTTAPPTTVVPAPDTSTAVWPYAESGIRYEDPVDAARGFAVDFVGFADPVVGELQQGDSRSGEVEVRPKADGPVTTVFVRQLGPDDTWWVLGAATANIQLSEPDASATISSPVRLRGVSTAFEGTVGADVRQDGSVQPLGDGFVMGGSMGEMGPFDGTLTFTTPSTTSGAIVLFTTSMEDGRMWEATVMRIHFAASEGNGALVACGDYVPARPAAGAGQMAVAVFYTCGEDLEGTPVAVYRLVPTTPGVLRAALEQLLAGPTGGERDVGFESWFSADTAGMVNGVNLRADGHAVVDFGDLRQVIPNASSSAGSRLLLSQLDATVFQFPSVHSVEYRLNGDCEAFSEWLQFGGCDARLRP